MPTDIFSDQLIAPTYNSKGREDKTIPDMSGWKVATLALKECSLTLRFDSSNTYTRCRILAENFGPASIRANGRVPSDSANVLWGR